MIRDLDIKRYRCFESATLHDCRRVNIIVGDNGSGKTSLLEAVMLAAGPSPAITLRLRQWRGFEGQPQASSKELYDTLWADLFHKFDFSKVISIATRGDIVHTRRLTISYTPREVLLPIAERAGVRAQERTPISFRWNISHRNPIDVNPRLEDGAIKIPPTPDPPTETFFFAANHTYSSIETAGRLSKLSRKSVDKRVIEHFRKHYPNVEDLSVNLAAGIPMVFAKIFGFDEKIPLNIVSGGMNKLASILFSFPIAPQCTVLIDEIENGFYFRKLPEIWSTLLDFCEQYDAQIFATTHSGECLVAASTVAAKHPESFSVIHAEANGGLRQYYGHQFTEAMSENIEIR